MAGQTLFHVTLSTQAVPVFRGIPCIIRIVLNMLSLVVEANCSRRSNGEEQAHIPGDASGNRGSNNKFNSNNHNTNRSTNHSGNSFREFYTINFFFGASIPPPPTSHGISRTPTELLNANQVLHQAKRERRKSPALHYAAEVRDEAEVERILKDWSVERLMSKRMRDVGEKDKQNGMNPLHYAAKCGNQTIVRLILSYHAEKALLEFNSRSRREGEQPPKDFPKTGPPIKPEDAVKSLLASKSKKSKGHGRDALHYAASGGHVDVARVLLEFGADIKGKCSGAGMNSMHYAAELGHVDILSLLRSHLDSQEDITNKPNSAKRSGEGGNSHKPHMGKRQTSSPSGT